MKFTPIAVLAALARGHAVHLREDQAGVVFAVARLARAAAVAPALCVVPTQLRSATAATATNGAPAAATTAG